MQLKRLTGAHVALRFTRGHRLTCRSLQISTLVCSLNLLSSTAQSAVASTYPPWILGWDLVHLLLKLCCSRQRNFTVTDTFCLVLIYAVQYYAYLGILSKSTKPNTNSNNANTQQSSNALVGGVYLDVLGALLLIQVGALWSRRSYWLLLLWAAHSLYRTFVPAVSTAPADARWSEGAAEEPAKTLKKGKRAEKTRAKAT
jgi:hypothetical protein